jgi:galactose mutarotase-like enzyme
MQDRHVLSNAYLTVTVKADGAELCSLRDAVDQELLWQAGPEWPRHAPLLFPIVGALKDNRLVHNGHDYELGRHGFARDRRFAWLERGSTSCRLSLHDDGQTRAHYPFPFKLEQAYVLDDDALEVRTTVTNTGRATLPAACGAHPAFQWPLGEDVAKALHTLEFEVDEPGPIRRLDAAGLVKPEAVASPVVGRVLTLDPALFDADAIIMEAPASRSVRFSGPGTPRVEVSWEGYRQLGIWSKPGADLLCIEPWYGTASPADWDGDFADKPGIMRIPAGEKRVMSYRIRVS